MTKPINSAVNSVLLLQRLNDITKSCDHAYRRSLKKGESGNSVTAPGGNSSSLYGDENFRKDTQLRSLKLGELLVDFGVITEELLKDALEEASLLGIPLGRVLVMSGWVTQRQVNWVIQLQSMLRDESISQQIAIQVADLLVSSNMSLEEALETTGCLYARDRRHAKLGDILVEADLISAEDLEEAMHKSQHLGLPLGRALYLAGLVSATILDTAVNAQRFIRKGKIEREDAVHAIRRAFLRQELDPNSSRTGNHIYNSTRGIKLGELLVLAGIISEAQIDYAVELGLVNNLPVGKVLKDLGLISDRTLENALVLQVMVQEASLNAQEAAYALIDTHYYGHSLTTAIGQCTEKDRKKQVIDFKDFLAGTGILPRQSLDETLKQAMESPYLVTKALTFMGVLDESTMQVAICLHFYIKENLLSFEEAMLVFENATRNSYSVDESMKELGMGPKLTCNSNKDNPCKEQHRPMLDILSVENLKDLSVA